MARSLAIEGFIERLADVRFDNCFNPYADRCATYDVEFAPEIRRENLYSILKVLTSMSTVDLWVGRDLGYRGGRRTGIALTDERSLSLYADHLGLSELHRATIGEPVKERTAANIFRIISSVNVSILTWNVFPFHPFERGNSFSNRQHTKQEAVTGFSFLEEIADIVNVRNIVAIGNDAALWAERLGRTTHRVRHPSYGGQTEFLEQMHGLYGISSLDQEQLTLF
ncbi:uracil-DNA glycosylase [Rhizobium rosettiformans]|uniref:Uracil-DNA glycosylase n=1 Tax=Rhizobium rosettiformans TaxID=1368430 RepID=A0ABX7EY49_9HYPH|nr:uracil-DNA glycosylase [Rhizobium rosettiformans]QRF53158.1 uracil-DNA glycosylase [Rhizobium rosettiformans]